MRFLGNCLRPCRHRGATIRRSTQDVLRKPCAGRFMDATTARVLQPYGSATTTFFGDSCWEGHGMPIAKSNAAGRFVMRNLILSLALALAPMVSMGCTSDGDGGGGDGQQALSFDGETALPAAGGAAISVEFGNRLAATLSAVLQAAADNSGAAPSVVRPKINIIGFCAMGEADLVLDGLLAVNETASLALTDCTGSPLSSTAVNGRILLQFTELDFPLQGPSLISATASFEGPMEGGLFTIAGDPDTTLVGTFVLEDATFTPNIFSPLTSYSMRLYQRNGDDDGTGPTDMFTISEGEGEERRTLELGCFSISTSVTIAPRAITSFDVSGVLRLDRKVYTMNNPRLSPGPDDISFPPDSTVPDSGSLILQSGDRTNVVDVPSVPPQTIGPPCGVFEGPSGRVMGDASNMTATFDPPPEGRVTMEVAGVTGCFECETTWENLLNTLSEILSPDSCSEIDCGVSGGVPYCASYAEESHTCLAFPDLGNDVLVEIEGETITYKMTVDEVEVSATGAWNAGDRTGSGTGDFVTWVSAECSSPTLNFEQEVRFGFDIMFTDAIRSGYSGTIELDFQLDPNCGPSICFASASVSGTSGLCGM